MPLCLHHVSWIRELPGGFHRCNLCGDIVGWGDVYPKPEDLSEEYRARWRAHEATRQAPSATAAPSAPAPT